MAKPKTYHQCKECGYTTPRWVGQCPGCLEWNTMEEVVETVGTPAQKAAAKAQNRNINMTRLRDVVAQETNRINTGITEFD